MIRTTRQLKALIRNQSGGDSSKVNTLMRNYVMERFLERVSLSEYKDQLILKGGMLVFYLVGLDNRATMDETEYPGIRIKMESRLENTRIPLKIDISTGDVISPRDIANTRLRDFCDVTILQIEKDNEFGC